LNHFAFGGLDRDLERCRGRVGAVNEFTASSQDSRFDAFNNVSTMKARVTFQSESEPRFPLVDWTAHGSTQEWSRAGRPVSAAARRAASRVGKGPCQAPFFMALPPAWAPRPSLQWRQSARWTTARGWFLGAERGRHDS